jgi:hypothetical protein
MPYYEVLLVREVTQTARVTVVAENGREAEQKALDAKVHEENWSSGNESRRIVPGETRKEDDEP